MDHVDDLSPTADTSRFLVERYWPGVSLADLSAAVADLRLALGSTRTAGSRVRHIRTTLVVVDETVFSVFEADSMESVSALNDRIGWPYDRILEIVEL